MVEIIIETLRSMHIVLYSFPASCSFTVKIFAGRSTSAAALESFGVCQAEDKAILAAEPPPVQRFPSSLLFLLRCVFPLFLDVLLAGSGGTKEEHF